MDLSTNMVCIAWDRSQDYKDLKVRFEIGDCTKHEFPAEYFDVIYSRDTLLHIQDKKSLFNRFKVRLLIVGQLNSSKLSTNWCLINLSIG